MKKPAGASFRLNAAILLLIIISPFIALSEPADLRCLPVLIQVVEPPAPTGPRAVHGTGFYFQSTNGFFLITAAHLFYRESQPDVLVGTEANFVSCVHSNNTDQRFVFHVDLARLKKDGNLRSVFNQDRDVAVVRLRKARANAVPADFEDVEGVRRMGLAVSQPDSAQACECFDDAPLGANLCIVGYPVSLYETVSAISSKQMDFTEPLAIQSIIAQKNPNTRRLIAECVAYPGDSGSPVAIVEPGVSDWRACKIVGVMHGIIPVPAKSLAARSAFDKNIANSGYAIIEPIDFALDLMRAMPEEK